MAIKLKEPSAKRATLVATAGIVWILVGTMLIMVALVWLSTTGSGYYVTFGLSLIAGLLVSRFAFSRLIAGNIKRIRELAPHKPKVCIFAFQAIQSYFMILLMMSLGYAMRHLPIPHKYTAAVYLIIGVALFKSGIDYLRAAKSLKDVN